ncbi:MAG: TetR family transcriptional regulator [Actinomycetota bacterium]|nr:TetR family transcriptional regulator [Actinomycetota bacterium]
MSPRRSVAAARETHSAIVERAAVVASVDGLEGLTIGRLAADLEMSKSGVLGHFGSKQALQLSVLDLAVVAFGQEVWESTSEMPNGRSRLLAICETWISYLERGVFGGGCLLTSTALEFDGRSGPVRDAVARALGRWYKLLERQAQAAIDLGELPVESDPAVIVFQLASLAMGANQALQLFGDRAAAQTARNAMRAVLSSSAYSGAPASAGGER